MDAFCDSCDHRTCNLTKHSSVVDASCSRHVSSCDVTRAVGMWEAIYHWILWRRFTLMPLCLRHMISRASTTLTFLLSHTFRETWRRDLRVECSSDFISCLQKSITVYVSGYTETGTTGMLSPPTAWRQSSHEVTWHDDMRLCRLTWRELTWREDSVSPALYRCDSVISSFVRTGYTTRRCGWLLGRIGCSI